MPNLTAADLEWTIAKIRKYAGTHGTDNLRALLIEDQKMTERETQDQAFVYASAYGALAYLAMDLVRQLDAAAGTGDL